MLLFAADNITLPSVKSWLADRLASFYHKMGFPSPACPIHDTVKEMELDIAYDDDYPSYYPILLGVPYAKEKRTDGGLHPRVRSLTCRLDNY